MIFGKLANADSWEDMASFAESHESFLRKYLELPNGIPSHDTLQRVFSLINPEVLQFFVTEWNNFLSTGEGEKLKKILNIDGKNQKALHVVSVWSKESGVCFGQRAVSDKENEITAIPDLLDRINIRNQIITIDAMGTQVKIADKIIKNKGDYVLALKRNQASFHNDVIDYFDEENQKRYKLSPSHYLLSVLKELNLNKKHSLKRKRYIVSLNVPKYMAQIHF